MTNTIAFRCDGGYDIGLGHIVRCFALAQMIDSKHEISFYCMEIPDALALEIQLRGFVVKKISSETEFLDVLDNSQIVVIDHYKLRSDYQLKIKSKGCKLICIDDLGEDTFYADLIINQAPGVSPTCYRAQHFTSFALGINYALLRPEFLENARKKRIITKINSVLICLGGADSQNLTCKILAEVLKVRQVEKISVVTGASYIHSKVLEELTEKFSIIEHLHAVNSREMASIMRNSDLAIIPTSGIFFEALASGCAIISSFYVSNQQNIYNGFKDLYAAYFVDNFDKVNETFLASIIHTFDGSSSRNLIDGFSGVRLNKLISDI